MYDLISDNIVSSVNAISFIYKLPTFNTELGNENSKKSSERLIVDIIKKVCLPGEILIVSDIPSAKNLMDKYYSKLDVNNDFTSKFKNELKEQLENKNLQEYYTYIIFNETSVKLSKKQLFTSKNKVINISNKRKKALIAYSNLILKEMQQRSNMIESLNATETIELINYMNFGNKKVSNDYIFNVKPNYLELTTENEEGQILNKYMSYAQIFEMPDSYKNSIGLIEKIKKYQFPLDISIKFDIHLNNLKLEKQMKNAKKDFKSMNEKYKKWNSDSNTLLEYENKIKIANKGIQNFQKDSSALIDFQVNIRLHSNMSYSVLEKRYELLKKLFKGYSINLVSCLGNQQTLNDHFQIGSMLYAENVMKLSDDYVSKLSLLSGSKIGTPEISNSTIAGYQVPSNKPVMLDEYAPLKGMTKKTQPSICYLGTTGSGKSQLANYHMIQNMIVNKARILVVDPKGDRKNFFKENSSLVNSYTEIIIGKNLKYKGAMDYFKSKSLDMDKSSIILKVVDLIKKFYKLAEKLDEFDLYNINENINSYMNSKEDYSMLDFMQYLSVQNDDNSIKLLQILQSFENMSYSNLFFGDNYSDSNINLDSQLTIIMLDGIEKPEQDAITSVLFTHVYSALTNFVQEFVRKYEKDEKTEVVLEEVAYLREQAGTQLDDEISRICRSFGVIFRYILQNPSDISEATLNNTGTYYIGVVENKEELKKLTNMFSLDIEKINFIFSNNEDEGMKESEKYNFLLVDSNNRKARIKAEFLPMYQNMFDTQLKEKNV